MLNDMSMKPDLSLLSVKTICVCCSPVGYEVYLKKATPFGPRPEAERGVVVTPTPGNGSCSLPTLAAGGASAGAGKVRVVVGKGLGSCTDGGSMDGVAPLGSG